MNGRRNDKALIEMLYDRYEQQIYGIAYAVLHDSYQAEDAVSETFIKLLKNADKLWGMDEKRTEKYVRKLAKNTAIDQYRRNQRETKRVVMVDADDDREEQLSGNPIEELLSAMGDEQRARQIIYTLPDKYRDVMICRVMHELSVRETALMLDINEGLVRKRYERAVKMLKKECFKIEQGGVYDGTSVSV